MKNYFDRETPLTICMWDYSWLLCGHPGGAFHDLTRRVEEAVERGYNTLRVDVFPNLYPNGLHTFPSAGARPRVMTWGKTFGDFDFEVDVRGKVIELANLCRKHGVLLGLDTWQSKAIIPESQIPMGGEEEATRRIANAWIESLPLMREDGVLEQAVWVAPLNEVPLFLGNKLEVVAKTDHGKRQEGQTAWCNHPPELDALYKRLNAYLGEGIKDALAGTRIPLSYSSLGAENFGARMPEYYDLVDVHFMPDLLLSEADAVALEKAGVGASRFSVHSAQADFDLALFSAAWNSACERNYPRMLDLSHEYAGNATQRLTLESGKQVECVLTEAYGPCCHPDHPEVDWDWYYRYNSDAARIFSQYPFGGLTVSNHAEPIFSAWRNIAWQTATNDFVLSGR